MNNKKKIILGDHKKVGSKFIPPMAQLEISDISTINQIFPEIIWMGLLNDSYGYREGIHLSSEIAKLAHAIHDSDKHVNFALSSSYEYLSDEKKKTLVEELERNNYLVKLQKSLYPLIKYYEGFPMTFLGDGGIAESKDFQIQKLKKTVERHFNRYETPGVIILANVVYIRAITGGLHIVQGLEPPNLESLVSDPESDEAKKTAAQVRSMAMMEAMSGDKEKSGSAWSQSFWNQGLKIDKCEF
ncbi:MAG: hypothetical protein KKF54_00940 [Candidatus Omnitrophica bacterium]|nr:hypothetical protein [Candidatus Omnitrophota bacterium]